jgi:hypothetical protein
MECSTPRIVHLRGEYDLTDYAAMPPYGFCTDTQVFACDGAVFVGWVVRRAQSYYR